MVDHFFGTCSCLQTVSGSFSSIRLIVVWFSCFRCLLCLLYIFLQYFDTAGWVFWPVKTVSHITYTVLAGTLNTAQSIFIDKTHRCTQYVLRSVVRWMPRVQRNHNQLLAWSLLQCHFDLSTAMPLDFSVADFLVLWHLTLHFKQFFCHYSCVSATEIITAHFWLFFSTLIHLICVL